MKNQATIFQIALGLAVVAVVISMLAQPAFAYRGGMTSSHGSSLGRSGNFVTQPNAGGSGGSNKSPSKGIAVNPKLKTNGRCFNRCFKRFGGMGEDGADYCWIQCTR